MILNKSNKIQARKFFNEILNLGIEFKLDDKVTKKHLSIQEGLGLINDLPEEGQDENSILEEFKQKVLPYCTNFSSRNFMGFPDAGNSVASIGGALLYNFLQQNLINQNFCGPSATLLRYALSIG